MKSRSPNIVILGGTGDLARKKLIPSLYRLWKDRNLQDLTIIGTSRKSLTDFEYRDYLQKDVPDLERWDEFASRIKYCQLNFSEKTDYSNLGELLEREDGDKIFYLATLPQHFPEISTHLSEYDLVDSRSKVLYEKPFGENLDSARELNEYVTSLFSEEKIYRIDHYLDKELVSNLTVLRFGNTIIEPIWSAEYIDHIQIIATEEYGVSGRGEFYDSYGAIKDFFQSHLMQLLVLTTMGCPSAFDAESIRDSKTEVLKKTSVERVLAGQYMGYRDESGVEEDSETETLAVMELKIDDSKWQDVPIYMFSGKKLQDKITRIYVQFRPPSHRLFDSDSDLAPNAAVVSIEPDKGIYLVLNTKVPGRLKGSRSRMEFCYTCHHGPNTPRAYENLISEAIEGDQRSFLREDEIEEAWRVVDGLDVGRPFVYSPGEVPQQVRDFMGDRDWFGI